MSIFMKLNLRNIFYLIVEIPNRLYTGFARASHVDAPTNHESRQTTHGAKGAFKP